MKKNRNIVFILFGIALIIFSFHAQTFNAGSYNFLESALIYLIYFSKYIPALLTNISTLSIKLTASFISLSLVIFTL